MNDTVQALIYAIPVILIAITLHEAMHAIASFWLGDDTAKHQGRISLNPIQHIDPFLTVGLPILLILAGLPPFGAAKPVQVNTMRLKWDEFGWAIVAIIGPLTNLLLAALAAITLRTIGGDSSAVLINFLSWTIIINIGFFIFNMIPWPPLDGSRLLYAFAPEPLQRFMNVIEAQGILGFFIFMLVVFPFLRPVFESASNFLLNGLL